MLGLFARPTRKPRKPRAATVWRARLSLEMLESRSGPSALYDPLVIEPPDSQSALWSTASNPDDPSVQSPTTTTSSPTPTYASDDTSTGGTEASAAQWGDPGGGEASAPGDGGTGGNLNLLSLGGQGSNNGLPPPATNQAPKIINFTATEGPGRVWTFQGQVVDESPAGLVVTLGGLPSLQAPPVTAVTSSNGSFSVCVMLQPGENGTATARTVDGGGLASNVATAIVTQTLP